MKRRATPARHLVMSWRARSLPRKTIFQNTNQNTLESPDFNNGQITSFGSFIRRITPKTEVSLSSCRYAHREGGFIWHRTAPFKSMPP